jgi:HEAT repeat protein
LILLLSLSLSYLATGQPLEKADEVSVEDIEHSVRLLGDGDSISRHTAMLGMQAYGDAAVPYLVAALSDSNEYRQMNAAIALGLIGVLNDSVETALFDLLQDPSPNIQQSAVQALGMLKSEKAVQLFIARLDDDDCPYKEAVASALGSIGVADDRAISALKRHLDHQDLEVRISSAAALGRLGPASESAIPLLVGMLGDTEGRCRGAAVYALGSIGDRMAIVVPAIIPLLEDPEKEVRFGAIAALARIAPAEQEAVESLTKVTQDEDRGIRGNAVFALGMIGPPAVSAIPSLKKSLSDHEPIDRGMVVEGLPDIYRPTVSAASVWSLARIAPDANDTIQLLFATLNEEDTSATLVGISVLDELGFNPDDHVPALFAGLRSSHIHIREWCIHALARLPSKDQYESEFVDALYLKYPDVEKGIREILGIFESNPNPVTLLLLPLLDSRDSSVAHTALQALAEREPDSEEVFDRLVDMLKGTSGHHRELVIAALGSMRPPMDEAVVPVLIELLQDENQGRYYSEIAYALGDIGPAAADAVPDLIELINPKNDYLTFAVLHAFAGIGPAAQPAVPEIIGVMRNPFGDSWFLGARALGAIGPGAVDGVPELIAGLGGLGPWVTGDTAVKALVQIGPGAAPELKAALYGENSRIAQGAAVALGMIGRQSGDVVSMLLSDLSDGDFRRRGLAVRALSVAGPASKPAVPELIAILEDERTGLQESAAYALSQIGPGAKDAVPLLLMALSDFRADTRRSAAYALARVEQRSNEVVAALAMALGDENLAVRSTVAYALSSMGDVAEPALIDALESGTPIVRSNAASALGQMESISESATSHLMSACQDRDLAVRRNVVAALGTIVPDNDTVRAALEVASDDEDDFVRDHAYRALHGRPKPPQRYIRSEFPLPAHHLEQVSVDSAEENVRHVVFRLVFDDTGQSVHLAGMKSYFESDGTMGYSTGCDQETIGLGWLDDDHLLQVGWSSIPQGNGAYTFRSIVILAKNGDQWKEVYRDSYESHASAGSSGSSSTGQGFVYEPRTNILIIESTRSGWSPVAAETPLGVGSPAHHPRRWTWDNSEGTAWRFRLHGDKFEYLDGRRWIDLGEHTFSVAEVAEYFDPRFPSELEARLRLLNPSLRDAETCSGWVLLGYDVPEHKPWTEDNYGSMK